MMTALGNRIRLASERSSTPCVRLTRSLQRAMRKRAENAESSFSLHGPMFLFALSMLVLANAATTDTLWSLIPASGGIMSLLHYYLSVRARERDSREAAALPPR